MRPLPGCVHSHVAGTSEHVIDKPPVTAFKKHGERRHRAAGNGKPNLRQMKRIWHSHFTTQNFHG